MSCSKRSTLRSHKLLENELNGSLLQASMQSLVMLFSPHMGMHHHHACQGMLFV